MADLAKAVSMATAKGGAGLTVEDVFSTYVYTGDAVNGRSIVNGIDLVDNEGLVWVKSRTTVTNNLLHDTLRGDTNQLNSNTTSAESTGYLTSLNADGFTVNNNTWINGAGVDYVSWTFRKAPRFFDVVKYTGNGVAGREIAHELGVAPGMMIVKNLDDGTANWAVYHKDIGNTKNLQLNTTNPAAASTVFWNDTTPTDTVFTLGTNKGVNVDTQEYIAYLFADDPLGESGDGSDGMIACGSFTTNSGAVVDIDVGWEPQYILVKASNVANNWEVYDNIRGWTTDVTTILNPNLSNAESTSTGIAPTPTGFKTTYGGTNTFIYMVIRRPMKTPESSDEVFAIDTRGSQSQTSAPGYISNFVVDAHLTREVDNVDPSYISSRLTGDKRLETTSTAAEVSAWPYGGLDYMLGHYDSFSAYANPHSYMFKRAAGFFDVVAYTGDGVAGRTVDHNLGVVPEMMIVKQRDNTTNWRVSHKDILANYSLALNDVFGAGDYPDPFNNTRPTDTVFTVGTTDSNLSTSLYIAYLFATLEGISKVGSYTGNGTSQTIDCAFAAGAKFIIIKRTDSTGDWFFWDSTRGIVAGNDPHLSLNTTAAEVTTDDSIDPDSSGFIVNQVAATNINVNTATYIFYAIAE